MAGVNMNSGNWREQFEARWGGVYDYSKVVYKHSRTDIIVICRTHGEFTVTPANHKQKEGCPNCKHGKRKAKNCVGDFVAAAHAKFEDRYTFPELIGKSYNERLPVESRIKIKCETHGEFTQKVRTFLDSVEGCNKCANVRRKEGAMSKRDKTLIDYPEFNDKIALWHNALNSVEFGAEAGLPNYYAKSSKTEVWWKCGDHPDNPIHNYKMSIVDRMRSTTTICKGCSGKEVVYGINSLADQPGLMERWIPELNPGIDPRKIYANAKIEIKLKCLVNEKHLITTTPNLYTTKRKCAECKGIKVNHEDAFAMRYPHLVKYWHVDNEKTPDKVMHSSGKAIKWICPENPKHVYIASPNTRTRCIACPKCMRKGYSLAAIEWLGFVAKKYNVDIKHAKNGGEYNIKELGKHKADGYLEHNGKRIIFEYNGSYFHGDTRVYDRDAVCHFKKKTYGQLYDETIERENRVRKAGYELVVMWEKDYRDNYEKIKAGDFKVDQLE